ncbi:MULTISPECIES: hypothetical protein [Corynebacterium]|uniref:Cell wall protein n=1 Tax=Corynebacterium hadale TaxID=2026255 RepID=A0A269PBS0_9CORY|nr:hypothetical protein [Corynebacterium hadale]PAJ69049.1 hypothetical protein CIG21_09330 [Corynebacterium hadale]WKC61270.1 hypothetical protein CHAD_12175 [Corynebacterium hadale]
MKRKFVGIATAAAVALSPITTVPFTAAANPAAVLAQTTGGSAATDFTTAAKQAPAVIPLAKGESKGKSTDLSSKVGGFIATVIFLGFMLWAIGWNSPYNPNGRFAEAYK